MYRIWNTSMKKIIVAGCGGMSNAWINPVLKREDCRIIALVDPADGKAGAKKDEHNLNCNVYTSLEEACNTEDADIVFDITPPEFHYKTVTTALKAGLHVFGEKPMAENQEDAEKMIQCSDDNKKEYFVMQNYRYVPEIAALKKFLRSNEIGNIGQISANFQLNPRFGGFRDQMESPLILDMSIHTFDAARYLSGANAKTVFCHEFNPAWSWYAGDANAVSIFEMEDGTVFDYRGSWCATGLLTPWNSEWRISCSEGTVFWDGKNELYWDGKKAPFGADPLKANEIPVEQMDNTGHSGCLGEMFEALEKGSLEKRIRPQTDCRDNIHSITMVFNAIESSKSKKLINFK